MTSVLPTVTATNHVAIATGAYPERTNIPANTLHNTETPLTATTSGFSAPIDAETLWEAAQRQGNEEIHRRFCRRRFLCTLAACENQTLGFGASMAFW